MDINRNIIWEKNFGGALSDYARNINQTDDAGPIVAGWTYSDDGDVGDNNGQLDFWIVKLTPDPVSIQELNTTNSTLSLTPVPASDYLYIQLELDAILDVSLLIYNTIGKLIHTQAIQNSIVRHNIHLDVSTYPSGAYIVEIITQDLKITGKFIKN